ncbi:class I SAM-dependent methyltransferase [Pontixanthobacter aquaemixtae]|uniref:Methyltransferase domain-containing protein n=1 Tax=Pontixanthobacter aquaemixtae TaxID=1958940 RepID=A0A844ZX73_9SPHN|nr:class I SAM-dependent methyltransferase [Pontixanthobacter aquaemixtae]MXO91357.1 methyltransferase domain-containing protein [Pontixanthobacter aquaemixtae]
MSETNIDQTTVDSFGEEWSHFDQSELIGDEWEEIFDTYFGIFPFAALPDGATGFDMGCGSGRWARGVAPKVGTLNCIDPAGSALAVAKKNLAGIDNVKFHHAGVDNAPLAPASQDFGYSLGVLHHIPQTEEALQSCTRLLKPGAPFLLYLYYRFDNRPGWFRALWKASELFRSGVSSLPDRIKPVVTDILAATLYWPLARGSRLIEKLGGNPAPIPLSFYRDKSFYTMRTDSRDRFGTPLEQRFTRSEIEAMMKGAGLDNIAFSDREPFWVAVGCKTATETAATAS